MKIFIVDGRFISGQAKGVTYLSEQLSTSNYLTPQTVSPDSAGIEDNALHRLAPVLKTIFHQYVISYTCNQSNSGGSNQSHQSKTGYKYI